MNGGSEANHLTLWTLLEPGDRLAFMLPNYMQGWGLGRHYGEATDTFTLKLGTAAGRWTSMSSMRRSAPRTKAVMVCNPNNPTGHVLTEDEMDAVVAAAEPGRRVDRLGRDLPRSRGRHGRGLADVLGPLRQGRRDERPVEGVRDAGPADRLGPRTAGPFAKESGSATTTRR